MSQTTTVTSNDSYTEDFESATSSNVEHTLSYLTKDSKSKKNEETRKKPENLKFKVLKEVQTQTDEIKVSKNFPCKFLCIFREVIYKVYNLISLVSSLSS